MRMPTGRDRKAAMPSQRPGRRRRHRAFARQCQVEREQRHAERGERDIAGADLALHQPAAQGPSRRRRRSRTPRGTGSRRRCRRRASLSRRTELRQEHARRPARTTRRRGSTARRRGARGHGAGWRSSQLQRVAAQAQPRRGGRRARHTEARRQAAARRSPEAARRQAAGPALERDREAAGDRAEQDRQEGAALHQRVAVDQFVGRQMLRQQRVAHRARQTSPARPA